MYLLLQRLMASSDFDLNEVRNLSIAAVREIAYRIAILAMPGALLASSVINGLLGNYLLAVFEIPLVLLLTISAWLLLKKNIRHVAPTIVLLTAMTLILTATLSGLREGIFFFYIFPVVIYLLFEKRQALYWNLAWIVICSIIVSWLFSTREALAYIFAHINILFYLEILFSIIVNHDAQLKQLAVKDPLTDAFNRRTMQETMDNLLLIHRRHGIASSIVMIDIDRFKALNDTYGHNEGDRALKKLVLLISNRLRNTDKICRYGGEEFVLILTNTCRQDAFHVAEVIREQVRGSLLSAKIPITISCGVAESRPHDSAKTWLHRCDEALYKAKQSGRDCVAMEDIA